MQLLAGILRVIGGCGVTVLMAAFYVVAVVLLPLGLAMYLARFVPLARRLHADPVPVQTRPASASRGTSEEDESRQEEDNP